jgi:hypothetical protein
MSREPDDATRGTYTNSSKTARYIPDRFAPPDNVKYPGGAVANPAFERRTVPPSFRFPARLREMGYGGEDGVYNENDGMLGWRVYRPAKLPHEWAQQITVSKEFIFMVMDVDGRELERVAGENSAPEADRFVSHALKSPSQDLPSTSYHRHANGVLSV